jgi:hypothetical protein
MNKLSTLPVVDNAADSVTVSGIGLAKNLFAIHGTNAAGKTVLVRPRIRLHQLLDMLAQLPLCIIGMEACPGAHHWARALVAFGHTPIDVPNFIGYSAHAERTTPMMRQPRLTSADVKQD